MATPIMQTRQEPLAKLYRKDPSHAWITDRASTAWKPDDPLHTSVKLGPEAHGPYPIALHRAVGGDNDGFVPGDLLCGALATCLDSTVRVVANRFGVELGALSVEVTAEVDVRGTLCLEPDVPVAFQRMRVRITLGLAEGTAPRLRTRLIETAEHCCVVLQTLRRSLPVYLEVVSADVPSDGPAAAPGASILR